MTTRNELLEQILAASPGGLADNCRIGYFDYNDLDTQTTPIAVTSATSPVLLTNDELGPQTIKTFKPVGITDVWDALTDVFDWSELKLGDMVDLRLALELTTTVVNTEVKVDLHLGTGGGAYTIPFIQETNFKTAGVHPLNRYNGIHLADANTLNNGGQFKISSDQDCTVKVIGWYCKVLIRG